MLISSPFTFKLLSKKGPPICTQSFQMSRDMCSLLGMIFVAFVCCRSFVSCIDTVVAILSDCCNTVAQSDGNCETIVKVPLPHYGHPDRKKEAFSAFSYYFEQSITRSWQRGSVN